jgi:quercetin dioxygenase-like cupin family protein
VAANDLHLDVEDEIRFRAEGPYTRKLVQTERCIVMIVCLEPGQVIPPHSHESREAFVYCLRGSVRFTPGEGPAEIGPGEMRFYDGARAISPRNAGSERAVYLVTLVRKKHA